MRIKLIAVGHKMPAWVNEAYQEYARRLPHDCRLELIEIPAAKRSKNSDLNKIKEKEGELMLKSIEARDWVVALEVKGKNWSTPQLASQLTQWQQQGQDVCLLVGGPEGMADACLQRANQLWSLSALTLPHPLVRVVLAETLYRAWTVTVNHPYHRE